MAEAVGAEEPTSSQLQGMSAVNIGYYFEIQNPEID
jgi:hypothetical protein